MKTIPLTKNASAFVLILSFFAFIFSCKQPRVVAAYVLPGRGLILYDNEKYILFKNNLWDPRHCVGYYSLQHDSIVLQNQFDAKLGAQFTTNYDPEFGNQKVVCLTLPPNACNLLGATFSVHINDTFSTKFRIIECSSIEMHLYHVIDSGIVAHSIQLIDSIDCLFSERIELNDTTANEFIVTLPETLPSGRIVNYLWGPTVVTRRTNDTVVVSHSACTSRQEFNLMIPGQKKKRQYRKYYSYFLSAEEKKFFLTDSIVHEH